VGDSAIVMGVCRCSFPRISEHASSETCSRCCDDGNKWDGVVVSVISVVGVVDMISVCFGDREWVGCGLWPVVLVSSSVVGCGLFFSSSFYIYCSKRL
jgi:hypothetical protein